MATFDRHDSSRRVGPRIEKPLTQAHAAASPDAAGSSTYLAGYRDAPAGGLASASVTFTVPTYTCTPAEERFGSLEANGVYTDSLSAFAFVGAACSGSGVSYDYFFDVGSANFGESGAAAGDVIVASLFESSSSTFVKIHDLTNGEFWDTDQPSNLGDSVVDLGTFNEETISGLRLTNFKKVAFTNATVNGDDLGFESPSAVNALEWRRSALADGRHQYDRHRFGLLGQVQGGLVTNRPVALRRERWSLASPPLSAGRRCRGPGQDTGIVAMDDPKSAAYNGAAGSNACCGTFSLNGRGWDDHSHSPHPTPDTGPAALRSRNSAGRAHGGARHRGVRSGCTRAADRDAADGTSGVGFS